MYLLTVRSIHAAAFALLLPCCGGRLPIPDGAWFVSIMSDKGMCGLSDLEAETGLVTDQSKQQVVIDGTMNTSINCFVTQNAGNSFQVQALGSDSSATGSSLTIDIPSITPGATMSSPATGTVAFISPRTADNLFSSNSCNFFFTSKSEGVVPGQMIWVTFECPELLNGPTMSTCDLNRGVAIFENCEVL
jgi:hypothetical protein